MLMNNDFSRYALESLLNTNKHTIDTVDPEATSVLDTFVSVLGKATEATEYSRVGKLYETYGIDSTGVQGSLKELGINITKQIHGNHAVVNWSRTDETNFYTAVNNAKSVASNALSDFINTVFRNSEHRQSLHSKVLALGKKCIELMPDERTTYANKNEALFGTKEIEGYDYNSYTSLIDVINRCLAAISATTLERISSDSLARIPEWHCFMTSRDVIVTGSKINLGDKEEIVGIATINAKDSRYSHGTFKKLNWTPSRVHEMNEKITACVDRYNTAVAGIERMCDMYFMAPNYDRNIRNLTINFYNIRILDIFCKQTMYYLFKQYLAMVRSY